MNAKRKMLIAVMSIATVSCAAAFAAASPRSVTTPLYTARMEQASSEMRFLPTTMNTFTYITREGYTLDHEASGDWYSGYHWFLASEISCPTVVTCESCIICPTDINCPTEGSTCEPTECFMNTCLDTQCDRTCYACG